jgi:hypothetical protein
MTSSGGRGIEEISGALNKIAPPKDAQIHAQNTNGGASGCSGHTSALPLGIHLTTIPQLDGRDYVAFDLEWRDRDDHSGGRTIYAAAFVDNDGNRKVLHISDFANSEPALLQAINEEILKYPASIGWYTTGIAGGSCNSMERRGGSTGAA